MNKNTHAGRLLAMTALALLASTGACSRPRDSIGEGVVSKTPSTQTGPTAAENIGEADRLRSAAAPRARLLVEWVPDTLSYTVRNEQNVPVTVGLEARVNPRGSTKAVALPSLELAAHEAVTQAVPLEAVMPAGAGASGPVQLFLRASARAGGAQLERVVTPAIFVERHGESVVVQDAAQRTRSLRASTSLAPSDLGLDPHIKGPDGTALTARLAGTGVVRRMTKAEWLASQSPDSEMTEVPRGAFMDKLSSQGGR